MPPDKPSQEAVQCDGNGRILTGECREAMSGPTCMNPDCPPCQTPEHEPCPGCSRCEPKSEAVEALAKQRWDSGYLEDDEADWETAKRLGLPGVRKALQQAQSDLKAREALELPKGIRKRSFENEQWIADADTPSIIAQAKAPLEAETERLKAQVRGAWANLGVSPTDEIIEGEYTLPEAVEQMQRSAKAQALAELREAARTERRRCEETPVSGSGISYWKNVEQFLSTFAPDQEGEQ